jgi:CRISPR-associated protein Csb1
MPTKQGTAGARAWSHLIAALGGGGPTAARWASALRLRCRLQPAGGPGAKVMPPTYAGDSGPTYITERRRIADTEHDCVLLDGSASEANRIESLIGEGVRSGEIPLPTIEVNQKEFGRRSGLDFSHRCFDSWIEDAHLDGQRFGESEIFKRLSSSPSRHSLTAMIETFPVGILLGCWASRKKDPQGTTRLARILTSEILAVDAVMGSRPASRIDCHHVSSAVKLTRTADTSIDRFEIATDPADGKPRKDAENPSTFGYGNVTPSFASHGGITMGYAIQTAIVSLPALRECGFPDDDGQRNTERDVAGRMMLATLALRMLALQVEHGYDLRSGCLLVPGEEPTIELVGRLGRTVASWTLIDLHTNRLLDQAIAAGRKHGLLWDGQRVALQASEVQLALLRQSLGRTAAEAA